MLPKIDTYRVRQNSEPRSACDDDGCGVGYGIPRRHDEMFADSNGTIESETHVDIYQIIILVVTNNNESEK